MDPEIPLDSLIGGNTSGTVRARRWTAFPGAAQSLSFEEFVLTGLSLDIHTPIRGRMPRRGLWVDHVQSCFLLSFVHP